MVRSRTVRRSHGELLIEDVFTVTEQRGRGLTSAIIQHVLEQEAAEGVYVQADNWSATGGWGAWRWSM